MLYQLQPNPIVAMNKAIASAYAISKENALNELQKINGLEHHHLYLASIGEIHFEMQNKTEAKKFYQKALHFTSSGHEQQLLVNKIKNCEAV